MKTTTTRLKPLARFPGMPRKADLRSAVVARCHGCNIQHTGWPCRTCFNTMFPERDRNDSLWAAVLAFRGDYDNQLIGDGWRTVVDIEFDRDGKFVRHVYAVVPLASLAARIVELCRELGVPCGGVQ